MVLHPRIRPYFAPEFLVHRPGVPGLCELVRHGTAENILLPYGTRGNANGYADIEAPADPFKGRLDDAVVQVTQAKVMFDDGTDCVPFCP